MLELLRVRLVVLIIINFINETVFKELSARFSHFLYMSSRKWELELVLEEQALSSPDKLRLVSA